MGPRLLVGGIIGSIIAVCLLAWYAGRKRRKELAAVAETLNFSFSEDPGVFLLPLLADFELGGHGHGKKGRNVMTGKSGDIDVTIFDFQYTTGSGKNSHTYLQTVGVFTSSALNLPTFALRPEHIFHKIGGVFGYQDIDFDRHPEFSKKYLLRADDEEACRAVFTGPVLRYFEGQKHIHTEGKGHTLLFYRQSKKVRPSDIPAFLQDGFGVFSLFKNPAPDN